MARFLVEVSRQPVALAEQRIRESVSALGSHFATHADWRKRGGLCTGSLVVEADNEAMALGVVPPNMRSHAHVLELETAVAA